MSIRSITVTFLLLSATPTAADQPDLHPPPPTPVPAEVLEKSIHRGVEFLLRTQKPDGSWGGPQWTGGVDVDPIPGAHYAFSAAVTAMCVEALLEVGGGATEVRQAVERGTDYLLQNLPKLRRADPGNLPNI
jgi:hypothetical protein